MPIERRLRASLAASSLLVFGLDAGLSAQPQSLGDVARRESERRKDAATAPGRVYTNEDLAAIDPPREPGQAVPAPAKVTGGAAAAPTPGPASTTEPQQTADTTTGSARKKHDERYWREWAKHMRERLAKARADLESARSSLSALDSGPKTPAVARERAVVAATVQRFQSDLRARQLEETELQRQAGINKIPAEWIQ